MTVIERQGNNNMRHIFLGGVHLSELDLVNAQVTNYSNSFVLAEGLIEACSMRDKNVHEYQALKRSIASAWGVSEIEVSRLCVITRQVIFFFDEYDSRRIG